ncbi:MAG: multiprotein-bridging factor 1 family protein [Candidatus Micrarchaeota archaeon]
MATCDICGKPAGLSAIVEGAQVNVCNNCSRFGKLLSQPHVYGSSAKSSQRPLEKEVQLVNGFGKLICSARESLGFSCVDLAKKLNMREADLLHFEESKFKPTEVEAKKIESILKIKLIVEKDSQSEKSTAIPQKKGLSSHVTLGDVVVIKDKRKVN